MAVLQFRATPDEILSLIKELTREEQETLLALLKHILEKSAGKKKSSRKKKTSPVAYFEVKNVTPIETPDEIRKKYSLRQKDLSKLTDLFKDAPSAEELVQLLSE